MHLNVLVNMDMKNQMRIDFTDFFKNGFQIFDGSLYSNQIDVTNIDWEYEGGIHNDYHPSNNKEIINSILYSIHYQLATDIVEPNFENYTVDKRRMWEGVNLDATNWHNDLSEGPNCFFLLYHSEMIKDGFIHFRNKCEEFTVVPKPGVLIAVNCENGFEHRADKSKQQRVISSYCFNVKHNYSYS
jgi:hypothetical protein